MSVKKAFSLAAAAALALTTSVSAFGYAHADEADVPANSPSEDPAQVAQYWTPERMRRAQPAPLPRRSSLRFRNRAVAPKPQLPSGYTEKETVLTAPQPAPGSPAYGRRDDKTVTAVAAVNGKVFFRDKGMDHDSKCSASAVNTPKKTVVITAGHCVLSAQTKAWVKNWVFVPGYHDGQAPYGKFAAVRMRTTPTWIKYNFGSMGTGGDIALVETAPNAAGKKVVETVGGHGLMLGGKLDYHALMVGYPTRLQRGEKVSFCDKDTGQYVWESKKFPILSGCNFGVGGSGGPWLSHYSKASGVGYVRGVSSFGPDDDAFMGSPYFSDQLKALYAQVESK